MILLYIFDGRNFSKIFDTKEIEIYKKKHVIQQCPLEKMNFKPVIAGAA